MRREPLLLYGKDCKDENLARLEGLRKRVDNSLQSNKRFLSQMTRISKIIDDLAKLLK